jgi:hypothetical protein
MIFRSVVILALTGNRAADVQHECPLICLADREDICDLMFMQSNDKTLATANKYLRNLALRRRILTHNAAASARIEGMDKAFAHAERISALLHPAPKATKRKTHRP